MEFVNGIVGGVIPREFISSVEAGVREAAHNGVLAGYTVQGVKVTLYDGSYHEVDSSEVAFKVAGSMAFQDGMRKADPALLEPVMDVEVAVPSEYVGSVVGDLNARRGRIGGIIPPDGRAGRGGHRSPERDVRLRDVVAFGNAGTGRVHDAVLALRGSTRERQAGDTGKDTRRRITVFLSGGSAACRRKDSSVPSPT